MRADIAAIVTEAQFQKAVMGAADTFGWLAYHDVDSRRNRAGFPDLVLARWERAGPGARVIFAELKTERGKLRPEQRRWADVLGCSRAEYYVWRPSDWDTVLDILR